MNYLRNKNKIILILDPGDEVIQCILDLAEKEKIGFAEISGIGATDYCKVGVFNLDTKAYDEHILTGNHEITNLTGTLSVMDGHPYQHLHITCANKDGVCVGGHLLQCKISLTCEIVIKISDTAVNRVKNDDIGINILNVQ